MYRDVLAVEPQNVHAWHLLGVAAHQRGQHGQAAQYIEGAVRLDPGQVAFHMSLSTVAMAMGRIDQAIAALREAIRLQPDHAKAHNDLGVVLANLQSLGRGGRLLSRRVGDPTRLRSCAQQFGKRSQ